MLFTKTFWLKLFLPNICVISEFFLEGKLRRKFMRGFHLYWATHARPTRRVNFILYHELRVKKLCARWVPCLLTLGQTWNELGTCRNVGPSALNFDEIISKNKVVTPLKTQIVVSHRTELLIESLYEGM